MGSSATSEILTAVLEVCQGCYTRRPELARASSRRLRRALPHAVICRNKCGQLVSDPAQMPDTGKKWTKRRRHPDKRGVEGKGEGEEGGRDVARPCQP